VDPNELQQTKAVFASLLTLPDDDLPLDVLCLLLCRLGGHDIDVKEQQALLTDDATGLPSSFEHLVPHLFAGPDAYRGNTENYYDPANSMLSEVRRTRLGIPITLSVLAIEFGRRARVPIRGIGMPGHFLIASGVDPDSFADPFDNGRLLARADARRIFERVSGGKAAWHDSYLEPTSTRDIVFRILNNLRVACSKQLSQRVHLPWINELSSWFPQGAPFDRRGADRLMAPFN